MRESDQPADVRTRLRLVKLLHTVVWAFFVACIAGIPVASTLGHFRAAAVLAAIVAAEVVVLLANGWTCPITDLAARYTDARHANFDIYLPEWLARHNKTIFGALYVAGVILAAVQWWQAGR